MILSFGVIGGRASCSSFLPSASVCRPFVCHNNNNNTNLNYINELCFQPKLMCDRIMATVDEMHAALPKDLAGIHAEPRRSSMPGAPPS